MNPLAALLLVLWVVFGAATVVTDSDPAVRGTAAAAAAVALAVLAYEIGKGVGTEGDR